VESSFVTPVQGKGLELFNPALTEKDLCLINSVRMPMRISTLRVLAWQSDGAGPSVSRLLQGAI